MFISLFHKKLNNALFYLNITTSIPTLYKDQINILFIKKFIES